MEAFLLYSLIFTVLYVFLSFIYFITKANTSNPNVPPGSTGWPVLGENIDMAVSGPEKYISDRMRRYSSEVFKTSILGEKMAVFCGAGGNKFLFSNENSLLTTWWPQSLTKPLLGPTDARNTVRKVALLNRSFIHEILKPENLKHYVPVMDSLAKEHIAQEWAPFGEVKELAKLREVKVYDLSKSYTFALACKLFLSIEGHDEVKRLSDPFILVTSGMFSLPLNLPGTAYNRAMKGGNMMRRQLLQVIKERKAEAMSSGKAADEGRDLLARLLSATDEEGQHMNEEEICNNLVGLLIASYDTTSAAITFVLKYLAELPHIYDQVYKDVLVCVFNTQRTPNISQKPEKFDPSRFEGSGPAPFTFVPFGGGPRMCPGKEYARLEVLVFMHNVVTNFKMEKLVPDEKIVFHASPVPFNGLPVRLIPHHN
nr:beta-amyrin 28-oxidase-like [Ipomoea batatas]